ncbi:cytochrome P450 [Flexibacterium corallicola]|uniref:cytochrome P450 n=1 Tax=Flexibacterium corallicola TaxID=3037259 RepID=UPI00286F4609|nr:cytochrome P450 [Pseudovibrio sp. M1P-2-3]
MTPVPRMSFLSADRINWGSLSQIMRFRAHTRPSELLETPVITRKIKGRKIALIADAAAAELTLFRSPYAFPKAEVQRKVAFAALGQGLSGTPGAQNSKQRRAIRPLFSSVLKHSIHSVAAEATKDAITRWLRQGVINLSMEMSELTLQVAWATLFGTGKYQGRESLITDVTQQLSKAHKANFIGNAKIIRQLTKYLISSGRWKSLPPDNPFSTIMGSSEAHSGGLSKEEVEANATVLAASGHVTTGITLAWCLWLMTRFPAYQEKLFNNIVTSEKPAKDPLLIAVINETMRLFPPGTETMRDATVPLSIGDDEIEAGALLIISIYALHRSLRYWQDPDSFQPERFLGSMNVPRGAFIPFSGGPYGCLGAAIAQEEMVQVMSVILKHIQLTPISIDGATAMGLEAGVCLYPDRPLLVHVAKR